MAYGPYYDQGSLRISLPKTDPYVQISDGDVSASLAGTFAAFSAWSWHKVAHDMNINKVPLHSSRQTVRF